MWRKEWVSRVLVGEAERRGERRRKRIYSDGPLIICRDRSHFYAYTHRVSGNVANKKEPRPDKRSGWRFGSIEGQPAGLNHLRFYIERERKKLADTSVSMRSEHLLPFFHQCGRVRYFMQKYGFFFRSARDAFYFSCIVLSS